MDLDRHSHAQGHGTGGSPRYQGMTLPPPSELGAPAVHREDVFEKEKRRAELRKERDELMEMLRRKEREIDEA
jgi:hypothetical protein